MGLVQLVDSPPPTPDNLNTRDIESLKQTLKAGTITPVVK